MTDIRRLSHKTGGNPNAPPPKDGLTRYYDHPQQGKGWNRREGLDEEKIASNWPMCGVGNHKMLCGECTKCGRSQAEVNLQEQEAP